MLSKFILFKSMADLVISKNNVPKYQLVVKKTSRENIERSINTPILNDRKLRYEDWYDRYEENITDMCVSLYEHVCSLAYSENLTIGINKEHFLRSLPLVIYRHSLNRYKQFHFLK